MNIDTPEGMEQAKRWQESLIDSVKDGGTWLVPRSGSVYTLDKAKKQATKVVQLVPDESVDRVFAALGWTVVTAVTKEKR